MNPVYRSVGTPPRRIKTPFDDAGFVPYNSVPHLLPPGMLAASGYSIGHAAAPLHQALRQRPANRVRCVCFAPRPQSRCTSDRPRRRRSWSANVRSHHVAFLSVSSTTLHQGSLKLSFPPFTKVRVALCTRQGRVCPCMCVARLAHASPSAPTADTGTGQMTKDAISLSTAGFQSIGALPSRAGLGAGSP